MARKSRRNTGTEEELPITVTELQNQINAGIYARLSVEKGEVVGLIGPSGYGKSTIAKILAGQIECEKGQVLLDGKKLPKKTQLKSSLRMVLIIFPFCLGSVSFKLSVI